MNDFFIYNEEDEKERRLLAELEGTYQGVGKENLPAEKPDEVDPIVGNVTPVSPVELEDEDTNMSKLTDFLTGKIEGATQQVKKEADTIRMPKSFQEADSWIQTGINYTSRGGAESVGNLIDSVQNIYNDYEDAMYQIKVRAANTAMNVASGSEQPLNLFAPVKLSESPVPDDAKMEVLGLISDQLRTWGAEKTPHDPKTLSEKLLHMTGYLIPDLMTLSKVSRSAEALALSTKYVSPIIARIVGAAGYGALTGGAEKAQDFTVLDILALPAKNFSRPLRAIWTAGTMGAYSHIMNDPDSEHYDEHGELMGAITGFVFGLMGPSGKKSWSKEVKKSAQKAKDWIIAQKAQGKTPEASMYAKSLMALHDDLSIRSLNYDHRIIEPIKEVQNWIYNATGERVVSDRAILTDKLAGVLRTGPGSEYINHELSVKTANRMVKLVYDMQTENTKLMKGLTATPVEDVGPPREVLVEGTTLKWPESKIQDLEILLIKKEAQARQKAKFEKRGDTVIAEEFGSKKTILRLNPTLKARLKDFWRLTVAPEGDWKGRIKSFPKFQKKLGESYNKMYQTSDRAAYDYERAIKYYNTLNDVQQKRLEGAIAATRDIDIFRRRSDKFMENSWMTERDMRTELDLIRDLTLAEEGVVGLQALDLGIEGYFMVQAEQLRNLYKSGVVSKKSYEAMKGNHYSVSKLMNTLDAEALVHEMGMRMTDLKGHNPVKSLLKPGAGFKSPNVFSLLDGTIGRTWGAIHKNTHIRNLYELASAHPENPIAMKVNRVHSQKGPDGKWREITKKRWNEIEDMKARKSAERKAEKLKPLPDDINPFDVAFKDYETDSVLRTKLNKQRLKLKQQREDAIKKTKRMQEKADRTPEDIAADTQERPLRQDFDRATPELGEVRYDITELKEHINIEGKIQADLAFILEQGIVTKRSAPTVPEGWSIIEYTWNSQKEYVGVPKDVKPLMSIRGEGLNDSRARFWTNVLTGTPVVKAFSVALNPLFGPKSIPRDLNFFAMTDGNVRSLLAYKARTYPRIFSNLSDALNQKGDYHKYRKAGGAAGESGTMTGIAMESIGGAAKSKVGWRSPKNSVSTQYKNAVKGLGYLSSMSEIAVRMTHAEYLNKYHGYDYNKAVWKTNELLNFKRTGPIMQVMDNWYPFANARTQVLDGFVQAVKGDYKKIRHFEKYYKTGERSNELTSEGKGFFTTKLFEYAAARAAMIGLAYSLAPKVMSDYPVDFRVQNNIIPIPGLVTEDENGQEIQGSLRWANEVNPITAMIDSLIYRTMDANYGYDTPERGEEFAKVWPKAFAPVDVGGFAPNINAVLSLMYNVDGFDYTSVWSNHNMGLEKDWKHKNTNRLAVAMAGVLEDIPSPISGTVSPLGVQGAANAYGLANNLATGFIGTLFHNQSYEARKDTSRAIYESMLNPVLKTWIYWGQTGEPRKRLQRINQGVTSQSKLVMDRFLGKNVDAWKQGSITIGQVHENIDNYEGSGDSYLNKITAHEAANRLVGSWELWNEAKELDPESIKKLPTWSELSFVPTMNPEARVKAYEVLTQPMDERTRTTFDYIAPAFGMSDVKFHAWKEYKAAIKRLDKERK